MNFKRLRGIAAAAFATLAAALLAGCMNPMAGSVDGNSNARMVTLSLSATGIPEEYAKEFAAYCERQNTSRSILPDDPFDIGKSDPTDGEGQSKGLIFVLTGKSETGMPYGPKTVTLAKTDTSGVYDFGETVALGSMSWNLCLTAYKSYTEGGTTNTPVLQGFCSVDLRNGSGTATFVMGIAGLTTPGSVNLSGKIIGTKDVSTYCTMGIYRKDNLKDVGGESNQTEKYKDDLEFNNPTEGEEPFIYTATEVPPGTYLYIMKFYKDNTKKTIVGSFTDTIVINPGNALKKDDLEINVLEKLPTEPKNLNAYLVKNSESSDGSTYNVKVTWEQAEYVTNYELNVVEYDENKTDGITTQFTPDSTSGEIKNGTIYGMKALDDASPKIVEDFPGSAVFGPDSSYMMYGDSSCVLKLETGKLYEIQLRARNYIGTSKWVDRVAGTETSQGTVYDAPATQRINRLLITYNLNSGSLELASGTTSKGSYVEYKSWTENAELLKIVSKDDTTGNKLTNKSGADFAAWLLDSGTAVKDLDEDTSVTTIVGDEVKGYTYKNVSVKASFGNKVTGNITQDAEIKDVLRSDISIIYTLSDGTAPDISATAERYVFSRLTNGKANKVKISLAKVGTNLSDDDIEYANVKFEIYGKDYENNRDTISSSNGQCEIDLTSFNGGNVMSVRVIADTKNAQGLSRTLIFELQ